MKRILLLVLLWPPLLLWIRYDLACSHVTAASSICMEGWHVLYAVCKNSSSASMV